MGLPFPLSELPVVDITVRMFTEPALVGDIQVLREVWEDERDRKATLLETLGVGAGDLQSADRFADLLRAFDCEPETKPGKSGPIYAFARTDAFMRDLLENEDDTLRTLAEARLAVKSTINQSVAERLGYMSLRGALAIYLNYCGTHVTLWSGGDGINYQNFKRGGRLRHSLAAPPGYLVGKADQSQVQCRLVNYIARETRVLDKFRAGDDPYIEIASQAYGHPVYKASKDDPRYLEMFQKRGTGKQLELSCGFGCGAKSIVATSFKGMYGVPVKIDLETGERWKHLYRSTHPRVVNLWAAGDIVLQKMHAGEVFEWLEGIIKFEGHYIIGPNGCWMHLAGLTWDKDWNSFKFMHAKGRWRRIWGGSLVQIIVQFLASALVRAAMVRIKNMGLKIVMQEHDAVGVLILDDANSSVTLDAVRNEMRRVPDWAPDLPLDADASIGPTYS